MLQIRTMLQAVLCFKSDYSKALSLHTPQLFRLAANRGHPLFHYTAFATILAIGLASEDQLTFNPVELFKIVFV